LATGMLIILKFRSETAKSVVSIILFALAVKIPQPPSHHELVGVGLIRELTRGAEVVGWDGSPNNGLRIPPEHPEGS